MCPHQHFRYKPHTLLADYPRLFVTKCIRVLAYKRTSDQQSYCLYCHDAANQPDDFKPALFHGLIDGPIDPLICSICKKDIIRSRKALDCFDCFTSYFELIGRLRTLNIDYRDVRLLFFNIIKREILRISTYDDDDEDEDQEYIE